MGFLFNIEHANLVSYLTVEETQRQPAPRASAIALNSFLNSLNSIAHGRRGIISTNLEWVHSVRSVARHHLHGLEERSHHLSKQGEPLEPQLVAELLDPLRPLFSGYSIYGLIVPERPWGDSERDFFEEAALSSQGHGLILMPDAPPGVLHILDPFPPLQALTTMPVAPPAVIFWTSLGGACALSLNKAKDFFRNKLLHLKAGKHVIDGMLRQRASETQTRICYTLVTYILATAARMRAADHQESF